MLDKEIHVHVHQEKDCEVVNLLTEIRDLLKGNESEQLKKQMDNWLLTLGKTLSKIKEVSEKV